MSKGHVSSNSQRNLNRLCRGLRFQGLGFTGFGETVGLGGGGWSGGVGTYCNFCSSNIP